MLKLKDFFKKEKGQALVELAITIPILLIILGGIIDFGWFFSNQLTLSYCSREGARYGIVNAAKATAVEDITNRALSVAPDYLKEKIDVDVTFSNPDRTQGDVKVKVRADVAVLTPIAGVFTNGQVLTLSSQTIMKIE